MQSYSHNERSGAVDSLIYIERKITIDASPSVVWNVLSNALTYEQWCDFKLAGGLIFHDSQVYVRSRGAADDSSSTRLRITKFIEPNVIEFSNVGCTWRPYIIFQLRQLDENETEVTYKRINGLWILFVFLMVYAIIMVNMMSELFTAPAMMFFIVIFALLMAVAAWKSVYTVRSQIEGSLVNLKHLVMNIPPSTLTVTATPTPAQAEYVRASSITPLEVHNPLPGQAKV